MSDSDRIREVTRERNTIYARREIVADREEVTAGQDTSSSSRAVEESRPSSSGYMALQDEEEEVDYAGPDEEEEDVTMDDAQSPDADSIWITCVSCKLRKVTTPEKIAVCSRCSEETCCSCHYPTQGDATFLCVVCTDGDAPKCNFCSRYL